MSADGLKMLFPYLTGKERKDLELLESLSENEGIERGEILPYRLYPEQKSWVEWAYRDDGYGIKMLLTAREYGKTDCVSIYGIISLLESNPELTFIVMSRTASKSRLIVSTIGKILEKRGHRGYFSETRVVLFQKTASKQPNVLSLAMTTSLKMYHVDYLVFDDPLDPEDEFSKAWRQRAFVRFQELSGAIAKRVIVLGQYVSEDDLYCFLEKQEGVDIRYAWRGTIPGLDKDLDKFRKEGKTERWIAKNYLGYLVKDETFPFQEIFVGDFGPPNGTVLGYMDPSFTGGDYTALAIGWIHGGNIVVRGFAWKRAWDEIVENIAFLCKEVGVRYLFYEGNSLGFMPEKIFHEKGILGERVLNNKNKNSRIYRIAYAVKQKRVVLDSGVPKSFLPYHQEFVNQVRSFREGCLFDDAPDALEGICRRLEGL